jgi:hypothetical protein
MFGRIRVRSDGSTVVQAWIGTRHIGRMQGESRMIPIGAGPSAGLV